MKNGIEALQADVVDHSVSVTALLQESHCSGKQAG